MDTDDAIAVASPTTGTTHFVRDDSPLSPDDIADAASARAATYANTQIGPVAIVDGYGIVVSVRRGCLQLDDGVGQHRRTRTVTRAQGGREVHRVLVLGVGTVTTEAMRWCDEQRLPLVVARPGGAEPYMLGVPSLLDMSALRRAAALAPYTTVGIEIVRSLLDRRLADQTRIAAGLLGRPDVADSIEALRRELAVAETTSDALRVEGNAALAYWGGWAAVRATFAPRDRGRVAEHWAAFGGRRSPLASEAPTASNRHAGDVIGGLLNFGYWVAQSEATIALLSMGLDPAMGLCHSNDLNRPAGALDLMEAGRGAVEEAVLRLVSERTLRKSSFVESRTGEIRLASPLAHEVASVLSPVLRALLGPVAEELAARLLPLADGRIRVSVPTPLSRARHGRVRRSPAASFGPACRGCGVVFPTGERKARSWCDDCLPEIRRSRDLHEVGPARRRERARTTPYASEAAAARAEAMRRQMTEQRRWEQEHKGMVLPDPSAFEPVRVALAGFRDADVAAAIGVSKSMAGQIRRGQQTPHIRHWAALSALAAAGCSSAEVLGRLSAASDPAWFSREVLPRLAAVKLSAIVAACGVNKSTASSWRRGKTSPRTSSLWPALAELVGVPCPFDVRDIAR
jgi:CRISPR-associated endonuclease Cas1